MKGKVYNLTDVVSIKFNCRGKTYFFDPNGIDVNEGDTVIVETAKGLDVGKAVIGNHPVPDESLIPPLRPVIRIATEDDYKKIEINKEREKEAFGICKEKIANHGLEMKLVKVECSFDGNKILFFFTADGRVDFRELVKDLASVFHTRIELRQIGVRDETKMQGGLGICGRPYCCSTFLNEFKPVSTKMAKTQSMSLNPAKISGCCGRLMCCLRYEQEAYEDLVKTIPKNGAFVQTTQGYGNVVGTNVLRQKVKVKLDGNGTQEIKEFNTDQIAVIPGGRPKEGEPLPDILEYVEKPKEEIEVSEDPWLAPTLFAFESDKPKQAKKTANEKNKKSKQYNNNRPKQGGGNNKSKPKNAKSNGQNGKQPQNKQKQNNQKQNNKGKQNNHNNQNNQAGNNQKQKNGKPNQKNNNQNRRRRNTNKQRPKQGNAPRNHRPKDAPKQANATKPKE